MDVTKVNLVNAAKVECPNCRHTTLIEVKASVHELDHGTFICEGCTRVLEIANGEARDGIQSWEDSLRFKGGVSQGRPIK